MSNQFGIHGVKGAKEAQRILNKTVGKNICAYCGKEIDLSSDDWSTEHIVPRAVAKWISIKEGKNVKGLIRKLSENTNFLIIHKECNIDKGSTILTIEEIEANENLTDEGKEAIKRYIKDTEKEIEEYRGVLKKILAKQNYRCFRCKEDLEIQDCTLRRKDVAKKRSCENAVGLCKECNKLFWSMQRK